MEQRHVLNSEDNCEDVDVSAGYHERGPRIGDSTGLTNTSFTVETWIKTTHVCMNDNAILACSELGIATNSGLHLLVRNGRLYFGFYGNDTAGRDVIIPNRWYHVTFRYTIESGEQAIFVNGCLDAHSFDHAALSGCCDLHISRYAGGRPLRGWIGTIVIYNYARTEDEIMASIHNPANPAFNARHAPLFLITPEMTYPLRLARVNISTLRHDMLGLRAVGHTQSSHTFGTHVLTSDDRRPYIASSVQLGLCDADFTVEAWVKLETVQPDAGVLACVTGASSTGLHLNIRDGKMYMGFYGDDLEGCTVLETGVWYHVAYRFTCMLYI
eukprot:TRINITY_DN1410_c0_g1_i1.p1 TRINITY_DN1410_c0_g1~~TRINITY_DN1410_c0_g1_i1.p1  ORF type:complete len:339 (-),score=27.14 TRINITY_DN1410_c0_g1_i1:699-1679(-)